MGREIDPFRTHATTLFLLTTWNLSRLPFATEEGLSAVNGHVAMGVGMPNAVPVV